MNEMNETEMGVSWNETVDCVCDSMKRMEEGMSVWMSV